MSDEIERSDWIKRVLGIDLPGGAAGPPMRPMGSLMAIWIDAKETVDVAIGKLQDSLRRTEDEDLQSIAEYGLHGATTGEAVELMAALRDVDARHSPEAMERLADAVEGFREFLDGAPIVDLIEDNPFGVAVPLRRTLGSALDELEQRIAA